MTELATPKDSDPTTQLSSLPARCGVYRFLDEQSSVLYVGKANNIKSRVLSYFRPTGLATKTMRLVERTKDIQFTVTESETEALLLEQSFIKREKPPFNVLLRDDKSYPYIHITEHEYPQIKRHRGRTHDRGTFFGPYPSTVAVRNSLSILQRVFQLRPCEDSMFKNRSRPCLQYQIKRCSGPCVGLIDPARYNQELRLAKLFLEGKSQSLLDELKSRMRELADLKQYEEAARLRDQIQDLRQVQEEQHVHKSSGDVDAFAIATAENYVCIQGMFIRNGILMGHRNWYPKNELQAHSASVLSSFVSQYYFGTVERNIPRTVLTMQSLEDNDVLAEALSKKAGHIVEVTSQVRASRAKWQEMVKENTNLALAAYVRTRQSESERLFDLQQLLELDKLPQRLECFDVSHTHGEETMAACVVFDLNGPVTSDYRRYKIKDIEPGDDYAALYQAVERRFKRIQNEEGPVPDILIIDGGRGQINKVEELLLSYTDKEVVLLGISKGEGRKPELDTVWRAGEGAVSLDPASGSMHLLQHLRDEAHRFAISGHRAARRRVRKQSELDEIEGIGPKRKRQLLTHFGSTATIRTASVAEIAKVPGISRKLAAEIHEVFHAT
ncbi:MAG: excinuclease ABC subunit UvrC [Gammaproteobacteria bacterium]|nr:excinuclease ABC subunit UvrC [Gammaproteobacteria bacterium]